MTEANEKRNVLLGITGSIAAYKSVELARLLVSRGYAVRAVMSDSACKFITPTTLATITGNSVVTDFWGSDSHTIEHIQLADWADVFVIAPATADTLAKLAYGFSDAPMLALALATRAPLLVAPAMNVNMFEHGKTQENMAVLRARGVRFIDPTEGSLACGWHGSGRLADPWQIFYEIRRALSAHDLENKRVLVTTGPTREMIDPVRFLSNRSSGKMGVALAREAFRRGAEVTLIHGPVYIKVPTTVRCIPVTTAEEMHRSVLDQVGSIKPDVVIMAAAVADFRPVEFSKAKIKKSSKEPVLKLAHNPDILSKLGELRGDAERPVLVGFAVETGELEDLLAEARAKLSSKKTDLMVGNFAQEAFDLDTNRVWLIDRTGRQDEVATTYKSRVATRVLDVVTRML